MREISFGKRCSFTAGRLWMTYVSSICNSYYLKPIGNNPHLQRSAAQVIVGYNAVECIFYVSNQIRFAIESGILAQWFFNAKGPIAEFSLSHAAWNNEIQQYVLAKDFNKRLHLRRAAV